LQCVAVCCSVLQCVAVCCSVLQCVAVCCSVLLIHVSMLKCISTYDPRVCDVMHRCRCMYVYMHVNTNFF